MVIISTIILIAWMQAKDQEITPKGLNFNGGIFYIVCIIYLTDSCNPFDFLDHPAKLLPQISFIGFPEYFV